MIPYTENFLGIDSSSLQYFEAGHGPEVVLAFHGFGQDHSAFESILPALADRYTCFVFNLFFHGKSTWAHGEQPLEPETWGHIIGQFLEEKKVGKFSIIAFSLGGKFALATLNRFPERINSILLIAPDGINTSFWYSLATYPLLFRKLFKSMIRHPERLHRLIRFGYLLRIADKGLLRFAEHQMNTEEKRERVYYTWVVFRHFRFDLTSIAKIINKHQVKTLMITGRHDNVIRSDKMTRLLKNINEFEHIELEAGHNDLIKQSVETLGKLRI